MKLKKFIAAGLVLSALTLSGCAESDAINIDKEKVPVNYTARYSVTTDKLSYTNNYTVAIIENELVISSEVNEPWSKQEGDKTIESTQIMTSVSKLNGTDNFGVPNHVEGEFKIENQPAYYTSFVFNHDHELNAGVLKTKKYSNNSETGFEEELFSLSLEKQYFDKDSLPFIIAGFTENEGSIKVSSGNRDSLQPVRYEKMGTEKLTVKAGSFDCTVIRLRPDSNFSVNSATLYIDTKTGVPVKVVHDSSVMELSSPISFN